MPDISQILPQANSLANLILVTPKQNKGITAQIPGAKTFLFHYEGEQSITLESDITDHYVEDNTAIQDHIALRPVVVNTHGYIGELNDVPPAALLPLKFIADKLTLLAPFTPQLTVSALIAYNKAFLLYSSAAVIADAGVSAWTSIVTGGQVQTKQQVAYSQFFGFWSARNLFTVQTPWAIYNDMAIKSLRAIQDEETRMISNFEVSFKQMRFASTITTIEKQGRASIQSGSPVDQGISNPVPSIGLQDQLLQSGLA